MANPSTTSTPVSTALLPNVVNDLQSQAGMAVIDVSDATAALHNHAFGAARQALNVVGESNVRRIQPDEDSAHVTGYHPASVTEGMSRYNAHRHGFVFSDGGMLQVEGVPSLKPK
jgi:hypothetical protein